MQFIVPLNYKKAGLFHQNLLTGPHFCLVESLRKSYVVQKNINKIYPLMMGAGPTNDK